MEEGNVFDLVLAAWRPLLESVVTFWYSLFAIAAVWDHDYERVSVPATTEDQRA